MMVCPVKYSMAGAIALLLASHVAAGAQETVNIGGSRIVLLRPAAPHASVILMPGGDGYIRAGENGTITRLRNNQLLRTRTLYFKRTLAVLVIDASTNVAAAVKYMAAIKRPVKIIATSRGTLRAVRGIAGGAHPDALVLISGFLTNDSGSGTNVANILRSPAALPRTLVIHHRRDGCRKTLPAGVKPFIAWAAGRARVVWLNGGIGRGNPCRSRSHHGFNGLDGKVVALAVGF